MTRKTKPPFPGHHVSTLKALANKNRLMIYGMLVGAGSDGLSAGLIANKINLSASLTSAHLKTLRLAGLIDQHREGTSLIYEAVLAPTISMMRFLFEDTLGRHRIALDFMREALRGRRGRWPMSRG